jgi:hypothetical protein
VTAGGSLADLFIPHTHRSISSPFFQREGLRLRIDRRTHEPDSFRRRLFRPRRDSPRGDFPRPRHRSGEAKPGQVVTLKIRVELDSGWWTYPTVQTDKAAANQINKFVFPKDGPLLFVGKTIDPTNPKSKAEPDLGIEKMLYYPGGGTFEHKVVVSPKAGKGEAEAKVTVKLTVCNTMNCVPGKYDVTAKLKVLDGPAVEVDSTYKAEVEKLLGK